MEARTPMNNTSKETSDSSVDLYLDITPDTCPITFVRTKLALERMEPGQVIEVRLRGAEPLKNVPRSVREHGHTVLSLEPEDAGGAADTVHRLLIRRE